MPSTYLYILGFIVAFILIAYVIYTIKKRSRYPQRITSQSNVTNPGGLNLSPTATMAGTDQEDLRNQNVMTSIVNSSNPHHMLAGEDHDPNALDMTMAGPAATPSMPLVDNSHAPQYSGLKPDTVANSTNNQKTYVTGSGDVTRGYNPFAAPPTPKVAQQPVQMKFVGNLSQQQPVDAHPSNPNPTQFIDPDVIQAQVVNNLTTNLKSQYEDQDVDSAVQPVVPEPVSPHASVVTGAGASNRVPSNPYPGMATSPATPAVPETTSFQNPALAVQAKHNEPLELPNTTQAVATSIDDDYQIDDYIIPSVASLAHDLPVSGSNLDPYLQDLNFTDDSDLDPEQAYFAQVKTAQGQMSPEQAQAYAQTQFRTGPLDDQTLPEDRVDNYWEQQQQLQHQVHQPERELTLAEEQALFAQKQFQAQSVVDITPTASAAKAAQTPPVAELDAENLTGLSEVEAFPQLDFDFMVPPVATTTAKETISSTNQQANTSVVPESTSMYDELDGESAYEMTATSAVTAHATATSSHDTSSFDQERYLSELNELGLTEADLARANPEYQATSQFLQQQAADASYPDYTQAGYTNILENSTCVAASTAPGTTASATHTPTVVPVAKTATGPITADKQLLAQQLAWKIQQQLMQHPEQLQAMAASLSGMASTTPATPAGVTADPAFPGMSSSAVITNSQNSASASTVTKSVPTKAAPSMPTSSMSGVPATPTTASGTTVASSELQLTPEMLASLAELTPHLATIQNTNNNLATATAVAQQPQQQHSETAMNGSQVEYGTSNVVPKVTDAPIVTNQVYPEIDSVVTSTNLDHQLATTDENAKINELRKLFPANAADYIVLKLVPIRTQGFSSVALYNYITRHMSEFIPDYDTLSYWSFCKTTHQQKAHNHQKHTFLYNIFTNLGQFTSNHLTEEYDYLLIFINKELFSMDQDDNLSTLLSRLHSISVDLKGEFILNDQVVNRASINSSSSTFRKYIGKLLNVDFTQDPALWLVNHPKATDKYQPYPQLSKDHSAISRK